MSARLDELQTCMVWCSCPSDVVLVSGMVAWPQSSSLWLAVYSVCCMWCDVGYDDVAVLIAVTVWVKPDHYGVVSSTFIADPVCGTQLRTSVREPLTDSTLARPAPPGVIRGYGSPSVAVHARHKCGIFIEEVSA